MQCWHCENKAERKIRVTNGYILAIDQSTSATKAMFFNERGELVHRCNASHEQFYPAEGWVEHDAKEIYRSLE
ncbi:MAG: FGGY family carbohydrate kinase, partial [Bacillota bacterium]